LLVALSAVLLLRINRVRLSGVAALLAVCVAVTGHPARAADSDAALSNLYFVGALGEVTSSLTPGKVTSRLEADGYEIQATDVQRTSLSGSLYVGYELPRQFALELGWSYLGRTRTELQGVVPASLDQLLYDASRVTRGSGDAWPLLVRYRWALEPKLSLDVRAGPYRWVTHSDLWVGSVQQLNRNDRGWGYTLGVGPRYALSERWALAVNANYFASTSDNRFIQVSAGIDYRL
jgi:opacity protein-like surface antigen